MLFTRPDGVKLGGLDPVRRMLPFLLPTRNQASVLCRQQVEVAPLREFLADWNRDREGARQATLFHLVLRALAMSLHERPRLNRFVMGGRLWARKGLWISFSGKQGMSDDAPVYTRKREFAANEDLASVVDGLTAASASGRSGVETDSDKEVSLLLRLPAPLLRLVIGLARLLDTLNLLPAAMLRADPLYASAFVANLGSVGIDACYHHNYDYGSIPIFVTMGRIHKAVVVTADDQLQAREVFELKFTYDERVEDGFYCARALERLAELLAHPDRLLEAPDLPLFAATSSPGSAC